MGRDMTGQVIGVGEAAKILGVHEDTVREWGAQDRIPEQRTMGGHRRYRRAEIERIAGVGSSVPAIRQPFNVNLSSLADRTGAFLPGNLVLTCGRSGSGQGVLDMHLIEAASAAGRRTVLVSLEQPRSQIAVRLAQRQWGVDREEAYRRLETDYENFVWPSQLTVIDHFPESIEEDIIPMTASRLHLMVRNLGGADLIVIDHLGLMQTEDETTQYVREAYRELLLSLRGLAQTTGALVVVNSSAPKHVPQMTPFDIDVLGDDLDEIVDAMVSVWLTEPWSDHREENTMLPRRGMRLSHNRRGTSGQIATLMIERGSLRTEVA